VLSASDEREDPDVENDELDTIGFDAELRTGVVSDEGVDVDQESEEIAEDEEEYALGSLPVWAGTAD